MPLTRLLDGSMPLADARELLEVTVVGRDWSEAASCIAENRAAEAITAQHSGHEVTAEQAMRWAVAAALFAQMAENSDTPAKATLYER